MNAPVRSMTGFGSASTELPGLSVWVEIRSVNQRGLRVGVRSRPSLGAFEKQVRDSISNTIARGQVDISVELTRVQQDPAAILNLELASGAIHALRALQKEHHLAGELSLAEIVNIPGLFESGKRESVTDEEYPAIDSALCTAVSQLIKMRETEGEATIQSLRRNMEAIESFRSLAQRLAPGVIVRTRERLLSRLADLSVVSVDNNALEREVAFFADRADINEELERLTSHLSQFASTLASGGEIGKRLEFLAQEMLREVNTTASKANDTEISTSAVEAKLAIEKIKEQAANIE